ncbi:hypothetical protein KCU85_g400, partial [Aureobasidium melanogenum]
MCHPTLTPTAAACDNARTESTLPRCLSWCNVCSDDVECKRPWKSLHIPQTLVQPSSTSSEQEVCSDISLSPSQMESLLFPRLKVAPSSASSSVTSLLV